MKPIVYINPPESCNLCEGDFDGVMYDARIPAVGRWANMCQCCFDDCGCQLGIGLGQKYVLIDGEFLKEAVAVFDPPTPEIG